MIALIMILWFGYWLFSDSKDNKTSSDEDCDIDFDFERYVKQHKKR